MSSFQKQQTLPKYLTDRKLKMSTVFILEIEGTKKDKIFNFLKSFFSVMGGPMDVILVCFQTPMWGF